MFKSWCFMQKYWPGKFTRNTVMPHAAHYKIRHYLDLTNQTRLHWSHSCRDYFWCSKFTDTHCDVICRNLVIRAEILLPCAEKLPIFGSVQKYYYPGTNVPGISCRAIFGVREEILIVGEIFTSALTPLPALCTCRMGHCLSVLSCTSPSSLFWGWLLDRETVQFYINMVITLI